MKITMLRNPGTALLKKLGGLDRQAELVEKAVVDVPTGLASALIENDVAVAGEVVQGVAKDAAIHGVPSEKSEVADLTVPLATERIAGMRSKEKLQHIVDNDTRSTVQEAAKKRIAELG